MMRLAAKLGWIGTLLIVVSVIGFVYAGGSFTHADNLAPSAALMSEHIHMEEVAPHHHAQPPCADCAIPLDDNPMHCGAKILALSRVQIVQSPAFRYTVPAHEIRDLIAQVFTPDPPPPRLV